ncbi:MAG: hypothetical protein GXP14_14255 [Gammaproteobacteria bacterium]|nr:hypothetical protein [Gammaproteobacteria bacterium]
MSKVAEKPLLIAAIGMDSRACEVLRMSFQGPGKGCCFLVDEGAAEAIIFNMDTPDAKNIWNKYRAQHPKKPTIVMALKKPDFDDIYFIGKPVRIEQLIQKVNVIKKDLAALKEELDETEIILETSPLDGINTVTPTEKIDEPTDSISSFKQLPELDHEFCGSSPDIDLSKPDKKQAAFYNPSDFLQARLQWATETANNEGIALQITIKVNNDWKVIIFLPQSKRIINGLSDFQLRVVCTAPKYCTAVKVKRFSTEDSKNLEDRANNHGSVESLKPFMWKVALWTARGRLPVGTSLTTPVKLKHWPNLTRLQNTPNIMRIATIISDQPRPLPLVAKVLNIPQRHVFSFYAAMCSIKLTESVETSPEKTTKVTVTKHKQRGLFGRILKRLIGRR